MPIGVKVFQNMSNLHLREADQKNTELCCSRQSSTNQILPTASIGKPTGNQWQHFSST